MSRVGAIEEIQLLDSKFHRFNSKVPSSLSIFGSMIKRQELSVVILAFPLTTYIHFVKFIPSLEKRTR